MKRYCPVCGYDQFGAIPAEADVEDPRIRCGECGEQVHPDDLATFSRQPGWWYSVVMPWCLSPAGIALVAPLLDRLVPGYALEARLTFWSLALSPVGLYILLAWIFARHRLARWYFGAIIASLVLVVANALLIGLMVVVRT